MQHFLGVVRQRLDRIVAAVHADPLELPLDLGLLLPVLLQEEQVLAHDAAPAIDIQQREEVGEHQHLRGEVLRQPRGLEEAHLAKALGELVGREGVRAVRVDNPEDLRRTTRDLDAPVTEKAEDLCAVGVQNLQLQGLPVLREEVMPELEDVTFVTQVHEGVAELNEAQFPVTVAVEEAAPRQGDAATAPLLHHAQEALNLPVLFLGDAGLRLLPQPLLDLLLAFAALELRELLVEGLPRGRAELFPGDVLLRGRLRPGSLRLDGQPSGVQWALGLLGCKTSLLGARLLQRCRRLHQGCRRLPQRCCGPLQRCRRLLEGCRRLLRRNDRLLEGCHRLPQRCDRLLRRCCRLLGSCGRLLRRCCRLLRRCGRLLRRCCRLLQRCGKLVRRWRRLLRRCGRLLLRCCRPLQHCRSFLRRCHGLVRGCVGLLQPCCQLLQPCRPPLQRCCRIPQHCCQLLRLRRSLLQGKRGRLQCCRRRLLPRSC
mmetsp:Transcript_78259/g.243031  ORF Transcript_78259/g.243031 Transcript_78259/m.243031 type:complete len:483 (-) Transcript_78259:691-2139(-)